ncbi:MAG: hypothetical protein ABI784_02215 [Ginsengibacter sp.]
MRSILFYSFVMAHLISCAQVHNIAQKTLATYTVQMPGNVAVDASGNELTQGKIIAVIYIETTSKDLDIQNALAGKSKYALTQQLVNKSPYIAGINFKNNEKVIVDVAKKNFLWKIELAPFPVKKDNINQLDTILLKGTYQGKSFEEKITNWVELAGIPIY